MRDNETTVGIVGHFHRAPNGLTRLFTLTVITETYSRHYQKTLVGQNTYNVDWSRQYGYLFDQAGAGGGKVVTVDGLFFCSGDVEIRRKPCCLVHHADKPPWRGRKTRRLRRLNATRRMMRPPGHIDIGPGQDLFDWLQRNGIEQDAVHCSSCRDWIPGNELCEHCWWCETNCWYSTPSEPCGHPRETCEEGHR